jgi:hypothetical protein
MKKVLSILFAIILLCIGIIPSYAANPVISINTVSSASVGDIITVSVNLSANSKLAGINFIVSFNTTEFTLVSESVSTSSLLMGITNVENSTIKYAGVSDAVVNSGGTLLSFKLKVLKTGGRISLSLNDAIDEIFSQIIEALGISAVSIHDGTTNQVKTTSGEISEMLETSCKSNCVPVIVLIRICIKRNNLFLLIIIICDLNKYINN